MQFERGIGTDPRCGLKSRPLFSFSVSVDFWVLKEKAPICSDDVGTLRAAVLDPSLDPFCKVSGVRYGYIYTETEFKIFIFLVRARRRRRRRNVGRVSGYGLVSESLLSGLLASGKLCLNL